MEGMHRACESCAEHPCSLPEGAPLPKSPCIQPGNSLSPVLLGIIKASLHGHDWLNH